VEEGATHPYLTVRASMLLALTVYHEYHSESTYAGRGSFSPTGETFSLIVIFLSCNSSRNQ